MKNKNKNIEKIKFQLTAEELFDLLSNAYRHGYASFEIIEAGLESYDPDGYSDYIMKGLKEKIII